MKRINVKINKVYKKELPYSEVCMHIKLAGKICSVILRPSKMVDLLDKNGKIFSCPILPSEAGFYNTRGQYYYYK